MHKSLFSSSFDVIEVTSSYRANSYLVGKCETSGKCLENLQGQVQDYAAFVNVYQSCPCFHMVSNLQVWEVPL